ncbi:MAG: hypothetical protein M1816_000219 [Peltula sp. TS41687]|nr:MAG: hypothetical protein M1816_000219 [Peltula sp. TS41687]
MANVKESRSTSQQRPPSSSESGPLPTRPYKLRRQSHSLTLGTIGQTHRVTRRKSMSSSANANHVAAVAAAVKGAETSSNVTVTSPASRITTTEEKSSDKARDGHPVQRRKSAINDGHSSLSGPPNSRNTIKTRSRRASEGSQLLRSERRRESGTELKCETCGKAYKHSGCLTKHMWEHTPEWSFTSKLLMSKHQQVQLLEAASVLVSMNQTGYSGTELALDMPSDHSSASPAASGFSGLRDGLSSVSTSPPPREEGEYPTMAVDTSQRHRINRRSSIFSAYSRSYQSVQSSSVFGDAGSSVGTSNNFHYLRQGSTGGRSNSIHASSAGDHDADEESLAAAVGLLSCSYGTPKSGPIVPLADTDIPPVPPLPARFLGEREDKVHADTTGTSGPSSDQNQYGNPWSKREENAVEDDGYNTTKLHSDQEEDDNVFGRMED